MYSSRYNRLSLIGSLIAPALLLSTSAFSQTAGSSEQQEPTRVYTAVLHDQPPQDDPNAGKQPAPQPPPQPAPRHRYDVYVGPDGSIYFPNSSKTRSRFGGSWLNIGASLGSIYVARLNGSLSPDIGFSSQSHNDDRFFIAMLGAEYRRALVKPLKVEPAPADKPQPNGKAPAPKAGPTYKMPDLVPYVGISGGMTVGDLRSIEDNVHSGVRTGAYGTGHLGVTYKNRAYIEARYTEFSQFKGFDLSGFSVEAGYRWEFKL